MFKESEKKRKIINTIFRFNIRVKLFLETLIFVTRTKIET